MQRACVRSRVFDVLSAPKSPDVASYDITQEVKPRREKVDLKVEFSFSHHPPPARVSLGTASHYK